MLKTVFNKESKTVNIEASLAEFRWMGLTMGMGFFGPGAAFILGAITEAAKSTETDDDFAAKVEAAFNEIKENNKHTLGEEQLEGIANMLVLALTLPRETVATMDTWYRGEAEQQSASE